MLLLPAPLIAFLPVLGVPGLDGPAIPQARRSQSRRGFYGSGWTCFAQMSWLPGRVAGASWVWGWDCQWGRGPARVGLVGHRFSVREKAWAAPYAGADLPPPQASSMKVPTACLTLPCRIFNFIHLTVNHPWEAAGS